MPAPAPAVEKATRYDQKLAGILAAAAQVFADVGYDRASIRQVADRARVSLGGLYYYVGSKEELLYLIQFHAFDCLVERYRAEAASLATPEEKIARLVQNHLERFMGNLAELAICSSELDRLKGRFRARIEQKQREYFALALKAFIELDHRHGGLKVPPRTAALAMFGAINWVYTWYRPGGGPSASALTRDFMKLILEGALPGERGRILAARRASDGKGERHVRAVFQHL